MTLADFIVENLDEILEEWVEFARTLASGSHLELEALRDHARAMLLTVARDMTTHQSDARQRSKSRGEVSVSESQTGSAAFAHGDQRYIEGFTIPELVSEYRALRATVIRLWARDTTLEERTLYELTRFNESIDQLLAESVFKFLEQLQHARELFMGVLGHDLRTDLQLILACSDRLERSSSKEAIKEYVPHIRESTNNIRAMAEDLLDVARTRLGGQLPMDIGQVDAALACDEVLHPFRVLYPQCDFRLQIDGSVSGEWDRKRLQQMLANLVRNAAQHGDMTRPITLSAHRLDDTVVFKVHNYGAPIPSAQISHVFNPMQQGERRNDPTSLGLGLYIASTIAKGHAGTLAVASSEAEGTTFTATLPRAHRESVTSEA